MIPITNQNLYIEALTALSAHRGQIGRAFKGRFIQIFLGLKFYQNNIPSMYSGAFITTEVLQSLLDDLYEKASRPPDQCVLSLFEGNHLARTGLTAPGNAGAQNTWRNNFNLQKGIGCYAPPQDLSSPTFLDEDRLQCRYLRPQNAGYLAGAHCSLSLTGASYRSENHRKWLRIDPNGNGYAATDLQQTSNFQPYVAPNGIRIPIYPLIIALYYDANQGLVGTRTAIDVANFMADFNFSITEFDVYFDDSSQNPLNQELLNSPNWPTGASLGSRLSTQPSQQTTTTVSKSPSRLPRSNTIPSTPILAGTATPPPSTNNGWEAEQFVMAALQSDGWAVHAVSRQQIGYDVFAKKGRNKLFIEVKSSLGLCSPSMTAREWQQANFYKQQFVLAVIENFNPLGLNTIYWIPDPVSCCSATQQTTISYRISRNSWTLATVPLTHL